jgi:hypothetical protein
MQAAKPRELGERPPQAGGQLVRRQHEYTFDPVPHRHQPADHHPGAAMPKLSEYVEMAANEYLQETGQDELDARWIAEFFQDGGVQDDYPRQDLVAFSAMVQKALTKKSDRAGKRTRFQLDKIVHFVRPLRKP